MGSCTRKGEKVHSTMELEGNRACDSHVLVRFAELLPSSVFQFDSSRCKVYARALWRYQMPPCFSLTVDVFDAHMGGNQENTHSMVSPHSLDSAEGAVSDFRPQDGATMESSLSSQRLPLDRNVQGTKCHRA